MRPITSLTFTQIVNLCDFPDETGIREGQIILPRITEELETWKEFLALWLKHQFVLAHLNCCQVCEPRAPRQVGSCDISNPENIIKEQLPSYSFGIPRHQETLKTTYIKIFIQAWVKKLTNFKCVMWD